MARQASPAATSREVGGKRSRAGTRSARERITASDGSTDNDPVAVGPIGEASDGVAASGSAPDDEAVVVGAAGVVMSRVPVSALGTEIDSRSLLFDPDWYREAYPDVAAAGLDPIRHFFENGAREGRQPNPFFDTNRYVETYADVAAARMNPFLHYLLYGAREGRQPR